MVVLQGQHASLPQFPNGAMMGWRTLSGPGSGYVSRNGTYHAPLTLLGERRITLEAGGENWTTQVPVLLEPGPVVRSDCLAPGQPEVRDTPDAVVPFDTKPDAILRIPPAYPDLAREAGVSGTVLVSAFVCACGEVADVRVVQSIPMLDEASVTALRQWIFVPALLNGEPVATWTEPIPIKFSLH